MTQFKQDAQHSARPTPVNDPTQPFKLAEKVCVVCGRPIERRNKHAAPGAWRHVK